MKLTFYNLAARKKKSLTAIVDIGARFPISRMNNVDKAVVTEKSLERQILETMLFILNLRVDWNGNAAFEICI